MGVVDEALLGKAHHILVVTERRAGRHRLTAQAWKWAWRRMAEFSGAASIRLYGQRLLVPPASIYARNARQFPLYNYFLLECAHLAHEWHGRPVHVVDVGSAVGDTALFLLTNHPKIVGTVTCVEGDPVHATLLRRNVGQIESIRVVESALSDGAPIRELVRLPGGTAQSFGAATTVVTTLDAVVRDRRTVDVLKIDTDGCDGLVLAGAKLTLVRDRPVVTFEWCPKLFVQFGYQPLQPFEVLADANYSDVLFFDKWGAFSHATSTADRRGLAMESELSLDQDLRVDWHWDVVALPAELKTDITAFAKLTRARSSAPTP